MVGLLWAHVNKGMCTPVLWNPHPGSKGRHSCTEPHCPAAQVPEAAARQCPCSGAFRSHCHTLPLLLHKPTCLCVIDTCAHTTAECRERCVKSHPTAFLSTAAKECRKDSNQNTPCNRICIFTNPSCPPTESELGLPALCLLLSQPLPRTRTAVRNSQTAVSQSTALQGCSSAPLSGTNLIFQVLMLNRVISSG